MTVVHKRGQVWINGRLATTQEVAELEAQRSAPTPVQPVTKPVLSPENNQWLINNLR